MGIFKWFVCLLLFCIIETSKVISGWVLRDLFRSLSDLFWSHLSLSDLHRSLSGLSWSHNERSTNSQWSMIFHGSFNDRQDHSKLSIDHQENVQKLNVWSHSKPKRPKIYTETAFHFLRSLRDRTYY